MSARRSTSAESAARFHALRRGRPLPRVTRLARRQPPPPPAAPPREPLRLHAKPDALAARGLAPPIRTLAVQRTVTLRSGGTVTVAVVADPFKLDPADRALVFGVLDRMATYEVPALEGDPSPPTPATAGRSRR